MPDNVAASMTASIVLDKSDLLAQILKGLSEGQKELQNNKLEMYFDFSNSKNQAEFEKVIQKYRKQLSSQEFVVQIKDQGIDETVKSLDKLVEIVESLASGKAFGTGSGNGKGIGNSIVDERQLKTVINLFEKMESHLGSMRKVISDVGDGDEFSPLLTMINKVDSSISELAKKTSSLSLNMNLDFGSDDKITAEVQSRTAKLLHTYENLFNRLKMSGTLDSNMQGYFDNFDINQYDNMNAKIAAYKNFITEMREMSKQQFGKDYLYSDIEKSYYSAVSGAQRSLNNVIKSESTSNNSIENLFGKTDLSEVISQLTIIVNKLDEISTSANNFTNVFKNGLDVNTSIQEVIDLTNRVKELEIELAKIKNVTPATVSPASETNISSGNKIINEQKTIQSEVDKTRENIKLLSDEYGQLIYANRGVSHTYGAGLNSNRYHGGTFWTKSTDLAANYGSKIEVANLSMNNPLEVDNKGNNWDEIELYENELTKLQEHIEKIKYKSETIQAELNSLSDNDDGFKLPSFDIDYDGNILSSYGNNIDVVESLEKFRDLFFGFVDLDDPKIQKSITDLYGYLQSYARMTQLLNSEQLNTNQVVEIAKELGHDGVIFKNIIDGSDEVTDIFVTLSQDQVHYVETLDSMTVKEKLAESKAQKLVESRKQLYENIKTFSDLDFDSVIKDFQEGIIPNIWSEFLNTQDFDDDFNNIKANLLKYVSELKSEFELPTKDAFHSDIDTSSSVKSLENLEEEIKKIFTDANELQNILDSLHNGKYFHLSWTTDGIDETGADGRVRQLSKLLEEYGYTINNFKSDSDAFDTSGVINAIKEENNVLEQNTQKVKENTQAKEQNANANLNKYDKRLDSYNGKIDKYQATIDRFNDGGWTSDTYLKNVQAVRDAVKQYATLLDNIKTNQNGIATDEDIQNLDEYEKKIKDTIATVTNMSASEKGYSRLAGQKEIDKINKILRENSAMSSEAKAKIKAYKQELISGNPSVSLEKIHGEILKIVNAEELAGRTGRSFFDTLKNSGFHQLAAQMAGMFGFYDVINVIKQAVSTVTELNTQITELAKVSEQSSKQIYADFDSYADIAKEVRGTISDTIAATADWSKNGYSIPDAKQLAEISQLYKNVGDGIDIDAANESLISTLKGFQLEADQAEHIVDVFNEVSNNEAISSGGIGEALQRSAASFNAASTSLEKSVSLVTATNSVLQNPEKVGNMWRTVSARLRGSETELKEMGEDTDGLVTSTSKLQALVKGITGFDIMKDKDTYKDIYDIVLGIGEKWQDLSDIDRASLLEALAGKQQSNALAAALSNIDILKKSYEEATNAEGSAREENEEYSKSIQASIDLAQAKLEQLANDTLNSNFLKGAIDAGGKLFDILDSIIKSGNAIPAVATAIAAAFSFKNVGIDTLVAY